MPDYLTLLNDAQKEAVTFGRGAALVLAGAGSGKTRVVTLRIAHLLQQGISPEQVLALTFTNKAAEEMRERVEGLSDCRVLVTTFHSLGARVLRESIHHLGYSPSFAIYDEQDVEKLLRAIAKEQGLPTAKSDLKRIRREISEAKNSLAPPNNDPLYHAYRARLREYNAVDFDDLLLLTVELFREHGEVLSHYQERWKYLLIDEYQDTNAPQYEMVRLLAEKSGNVFVVGDPDQSIYSWRGADITNILHFERDWPGAKVIRLEQNYRSRENILEAANALISHNKARYKKSLRGTKGEGEPIRLLSADDDIEESTYVVGEIESQRRKGVALREMVIFYRTNFQSRVFEDRLLSADLPYVIVGGLSFYQRREIKDAMAFLRLVQDDSDFVAFDRVINLPKRGIGAASIEKLRTAARENQLPILQLLREMPLKMGAKQKRALREFLEVIEVLRERYRTRGLRQLLLGVMHQTGYLDELAKDEETYEDRKLNLEELVTKAAEWEEGEHEEHLTSFLQELSLKSSVDAMERGSDRVHLMTLHSGKGLEFSVAFLVGLEEGLFPHINVRDDEEAIEEERRLFYVGITRAKEQLYLSYAMERRLWGGYRSMRPSRFLQEIPKKLVRRV